MHINQRTECLKAFWINYCNVLQLKGLCKQEILILNSDKKKLGYVPEKDNVVFSRLMDAGKILKAKVANIEEKGSWTKVTIGIYLVDL